MKKFVALLIASLMLLTAAFALADALAEAPVAGGWSVAASAEITEEKQALFEKAMAELLGVNYEPVAYLGSQVVAGLNHCFLCRATVVYPNAAPSLVLVYIYENLEGNAQMTNIVNLDIAAMAVPAE